MGQQHRNNRRQLWGCVSSQTACSAAVIALLAGSTVAFGQAGQANPQPGLTGPQGTPVTAGQPAAPGQPGVPNLPPAPGAGAGAADAKGTWPPPTVVGAGQPMPGQAAGPDVQ